MNVYMLYHVHELPGGEEDSKLIGVYSSEANARAAILRVSGAPGFKEHPDGFQIHPKEVDKDSWLEGFVTL